MPADERLPLSEREIEILSLVATGKTNQEIARVLVISPNTVKVHLRNIFEKLHVQSRTEATLVAIRSGLVQIGQVSLAPTDSPTALDGAIADSVAVDVLPPPLKPALTAWRPDLAPRQPIRRWQRVYLVVSLLVVTLALLFPWMRSVAGRSQAASQSLLSDAEMPQAGLPARQDAARWRVRAALPAPRARHALVAFRGQVYAIGGETPTGITDSVDVYNPERNDWQPRTNLPRPLSNVQAVVLKNLVYVPGGTTTGGALSAEVLSYDPVADSWGQAPALPAPAAAYALAASDSMLFLLGGWDGTQVTTTVLIYDPAVRRWRDGPPLPAPRALASAAILNGRLFLVGGFDGAQPQPTVYTLALNADGGVADGGWETGAPLSTPRSGLGVIVESGALYAFGGSVNAAVDFQERFDPFTQTWSSIVSPWRGEWRGVGVSAVSPMIYVVGGWSGDYAEVNEQYQAGFRTFLPASPR
jgi:DNA-binding CsgD family transcriptional regulator/N-acetylneuraminic acid mutarotase